MFENQLTREHLEKLETSSVHALAQQIVAGDGPLEGRAKAALLARQWQIAYQAAVNLDSELLVRGGLALGFSSAESDRMAHSSSLLARYTAAWESQWQDLAHWIEKIRPDLAASLLSGKVPNISKVALSKPAHALAARNYKALAQAEKAS
jgi:hypothetical protein